MVMEKGAEEEEANRSGQRNVLGVIIMMIVVIAIYFPPPFNYLSSIIPQQPLAISAAARCPAEALYTPNIYAN